MFNVSKYSTKPMLVKQSGSPLLADHHPLLVARGRDRLETSENPNSSKKTSLIPYSLGDAIAWKPTSYKLDRVRT